MYLTHLSLTNFRSFARLDVAVPRGPVLLVGGNAQGKTSLLEAIYFLATYESFHATSDRQLVNFLASQEPVVVARIVAEFRRKKGTEGSAEPTNHKMEVRVIQEPSGLNGTPRLRKEILLNGLKRKVSEAVGEFNAVLFLPHMLRIVEGAPEERRRYLNMALIQVEPQYALALSEYGRILTQRNALLKQLSERGGDVQQLSYWDEQLSVYGAQLIHARIRAIQELERLAARIHGELTRSQEVLRLSYQPAFDPLQKKTSQYTLPIDAPLDRSRLSLEKIQNSFLESLTRLHSEEIARGVTTLGPHRDELRFLSNQIDLGTFGSRGQARTAVLSLKLAEVDWMNGRTGQWPVLLLDEVLAELDTDRRADLLERLSQSEQALLTTTDLDLFSSKFIIKSKVWNIQGGRLVQEAEKRDA